MIKIVREPLSAESAEKFTYTITWCGVTFAMIAALIVGIGMIVQGTYMHNDLRFLEGIGFLVLFVLVLNPGKFYAEKVSKS